MPNSYTAIPNIIPGNLQVTGNVTIQGDRLTIGAAAPFVRVGKDNGGGLYLAQNLGFDDTTKDVGGSETWALKSQVGSTIGEIIRTSPGGTFQNVTFPNVLFTDYSQHSSHTGTVTEDTIYTKTIRGGLMGLNGAIYVRVIIATGSQGAPNTVLAVKLGASCRINKSFNTGGDNFLMEAIITNQGAQNSQSNFAFTTDFVAKTRDGSTSSGSTDTSADQALTVTIQNGTSTDVQVPVYCEAVLLNSFGPV